jgi:hypothetical protein
MRVGQPASAGRAALPGRAFNSDSQKRGTFSFPVSHFFFYGNRQSWSAGETNKKHVGARKRRFFSR